MPIDPALHDGQYFDIDAFIRDLTTMAPTIATILALKSHASVDHQHGRNRRSKRPKIGLDCSSVLDCR
jgi:hypothetical protein